MRKRCTQNTPVTKDRGHKKHQNIIHKHTSTHKIFFTAIMAVIWELNIITTLVMYIMTPVNGLCIQMDIQTYQLTNAWTSNIMNNIWSIYGDI
jgi:hypothetical protein